MRKLLDGLAGLALALAGTSAAAAEDTVKIGIILPYSGQFADTGSQIDNGIKLYMKQHGDTVAGKKIEFIRKDTGGIAPDVAKRLAQELVVRDHVDILAGFALTPNALAAADISAEAKKFMVVMNAATSIITTKSPYIARTSIDHAATQSNARHLGGQARHQDRLHHGLRLRPRHRRRRRLPYRLQGSAAARLSARSASRSPIRISPPSCSAPRISIRTRSTSGFRAARSRPRSARRWPSAASILPKIKVMGQDALAFESALQEHGRCGARHNHRRRLRFQSSIRRSIMNSSKPTTRNSIATPTFFRSAAMTACISIYEALKKTGGKADGDSLIAAAKGMSWESPRGPISIDPETRDIIQTVLYSPRREGRRSASQCRVRHDRERQGPGEGAHEAVNAAIGQHRRALRHASGFRRPVRRPGLRDAAVPALGRAVGDARDDEFRQSGALQLRHARRLRHRHADECARLAVFRHAARRLRRRRRGQRGLGADVVSPLLSGERARADAC